MDYSGAPDLSGMCLRTATHRVVSASIDLSNYPNAGLFGIPYACVSSHEAEAMVKNGEATKTIFPGVIRRTGHVFKEKVNPHIIVRGFSARYGAWLSRNRRKPIAKVMLSQITLRPVEEWRR